MGMGCLRLTRGHQLAAFVATLVVGESQDGSLERDERAKLAMRLVARRSHDRQFS